MPVFTTIYDVTRAPDSGVMFILGFFFVLVSGGVSLLARRGSLGQPRIGADYTSGLGGFSTSIGIVMASIAAVYLAWRAVELGIWMLAASTGHYETLRGCVADFSERRSVASTPTIDAFSLGGRGFTISSSDWTLGYNITQDRGGRIGPRSRLLVHALGDHMLKIDVSSADCP
jgi:hypothetical protein